METELTKLNLNNKENDDDKDKKNNKEYEEQIRLARCVLGTKCIFSCPQCGSKSKCKKEPSHAFIKPYSDHECENGHTWPLVKKD